MRFARPLPRFGTAAAILLSALLAAPFAHPVGVPPLLAGDAPAPDLPVLERIDLSPIPYELTMDLSLPQTARIQKHLASVEADLRATTPEGLSDAQRAERARLIDHLGEYRRAGVFPVNDFLPELTPVFVDRVGTHCAVGELLRVSGAEDLACDIASSTNFATVKELGAREDVIAWATRSGFTLAECARIQPAYCHGGAPSDVAFETVGNAVTVSWVNNDNYYNVHLWVQRVLPDQSLEFVGSWSVPGDETEALIPFLDYGSYTLDIFGDCGGFGGPFPPPIPFEVTMATFIRGDTNGDGLVNVADVIRTLGWLFSGDTPLGCLEAGDANGDGTVNIADPITVFGHLFFGDAPILAPFPDCGEEPAPNLSCDVSTACP